MIETVIFSGCGHELERVIADMSCPVCTRKELERLTAELKTQEVQYLLNLKRKDDEIQRLKYYINSLLKEIDDMDDEIDSWNDYD